MVERCPICGSKLINGICPTCGYKKQRIKTKFIKVVEVGYVLLK